MAPGGLELVVMRAGAMGCDGQMGKSRLIVWEPKILFMVLPIRRPVRTILSMAPKWRAMDMAILLAVGE